MTFLHWRIFFKSKGLKGPPQRSNGLIIFRVLGVFSTNHPVDPRLLLRHVCSSLTAILTPLHRELETHPLELFVQSAGLGQEVWIADVLVHGQRLLSRHSPDLVVHPGVVVQQLDEGLP